MKLNRPKGSCCDDLHGMEVLRYCDNCGLGLVAKDMGKHTVQCIDSVKAKKALECIEELTKQMRITAANEDWDDGWEAIHHTLKLFGFPT